MNYCPCCGNVFEVFWEKCFCVSNQSLMRLSFIEMGVIGTLYSPWFLHQYFNHLCLSHSFYDFFEFSRSISISPKSIRPELSLITMATHTKLVSVRKVPPAKIIRGIRNIWDMHLNFNDDAFEPRAYISDCVVEFHYPSGGLKHINVTAEARARIAGKRANLGGDMDRPCRPMAGAAKRGIFRLLEKEIQKLKPVALRKTAATQTENQGVPGTGIAVLPSDPNLAAFEANRSTGADKLISLSDDDNSEAHNPADDLGWELVDVDGEIYMAGVTKTHKQGWLQWMQGWSKL